MIAKGKFRFIFIFDRRLQLNFYSIFVIRFNVRTGAIYLIKGH